MLESAAFGNGKIQDAIDLKNQNLPKKIYKYREVTEYSLYNLCDNSVWVNSPIEYNDPYDCAGSFDMEELIHPNARIIKDQIECEIEKSNNFKKNKDIKGIGQEQKLLILMMLQKIII